ncbi:MAG: cupin domain-containing protein [Candidatus Omnitrophica bacterium]|nr:cupin domain-containing protein [Candidatus Omnitrophota bacterium]
MKDLKGKALNLSNLAAYQKGSIVSQEVIKKDSGTVSVFAFDKGEGLSEHTAPFDALVYILDGQATVFIDKKPHSLKKNEFIIMPAGIPHSLKAVKKFKMLLILIRK